MARGITPEATRKKYVVMTITYIIEPSLINMDESLEKLRETGAAGVTDIAVEELTDAEVRERTRD